MNQTAEGKKKTEKKELTRRLKNCDLLLARSNARSHKFVARQHERRPCYYPPSSTIHDLLFVPKSPTKQPTERILRISRPKLRPFLRPRRSNLVVGLTPHLPAASLRPCHDHGVPRSSSRPTLILLRARVLVLRKCISGGDGGRCGLAFRARSGADAAEGPSRRVEVLRRRLEHQQRALLGLGWLQRRAGLRRGRSLVCGVRPRSVPRRLLLLLLPRPQRLLLLRRDPGHLARAPRRLHGRRRRRVRRSVRWAGAVPRQHDGDGGLRGGAVPRHGGQPEDLLGLPEGGQGGRRGARRAARRRQGEDRRGRAQGELGFRRARRPHVEQLHQDPSRLGDNKEDSNCSCSCDADPCVCWSRVLGVWIGVACLRVGVSWVDSGRGDVCTVRYFSTPAQRGGGHLRGDGRMGAAPAGAHGAGRHPPVR